MLQWLVLAKRGEGVRKGVGLLIEFQGPVLLPHCYVDKDPRTPLPVSLVSFCKEKIALREIAPKKQS